MALENAVVVLRIEYPANRRRDSQHREVIAGYHFGLHALCLIVNAYRGGNQAAAQHFGERRSFLLVVLVDGVGMHAGAHVISVVGAALKEHHQLIRIFYGKLPEHELVHQSKDRGVRADAESKGKNGYGRKEWAAANGSQRESQVRP